MSEVPIYKAVEIGPQVGINYNQRFVDLWGIPDAALDSRSDQIALRSVISKLDNPEEFLKGIESRLRAQAVSRISRRSWLQSWGAAAAAILTAISGGLLARGAMHRSPSWASDRKDATPWASTIPTWDPADSAQ